MTDPEIWMTTENIRDATAPADIQGTPPLDLDAVRTHSSRDVPALIAEVTRLRQELAEAHTWHGLMALADEHYPTDIFPVEPDHEERDDGPRILSLLRHLEAARAEYRQLVIDDDEAGSELIRIEAERDVLAARLERAEAMRPEREWAGQMDTGDRSWFTTSPQYRREHAERERPEGGYLVYRDILAGPWTAFQATPTTSEPTP